MRRVRVRWVGRAVKHGCRYNMESRSRCSTFSPGREYVARSSSDRTASGSPPDNGEGRATMCQNVKLRADHLQAFIGVTQRQRVGTVAHARARAHGRLHHTFERARCIMLSSVPDQLSERTLNKERFIIPFRTPLSRARRHVCLSSGYRSAVPLHGCSHDNGASAASGERGG